MHGIYLTDFGICCGFLLEPFIYLLFHKLELQLFVSHAYKVNQNNIKNCHSTSVNNCVTIMYPSIGAKCNPVFCMLTVCSVKWPAPCTDSK